MKKHFRKLIGLMLTGTMILSTNILAFAGQASSTEKDAIIEVLNVIESSKDLYGLSDVNFEELEIGNAIQAYNYINDEFVESRVMYPLIVDGELVAFAKELKDGDNVHFQISTSLADKISQCIDVNTDFSIVYDKVGCYIYYNGNFNLLFEAPEPIEERTALSSSFERHKTNPMLLSNISETTPLDYTNIDFTTKASRARYELPISYVTQKPYGSLCWAASIASIVNYVTGSNLNAYRVGSAAHDLGYTSVINSSLQVKNAANFMEKKYNLGYQYLRGEPSDAVIIKNIKADYPIFGGFHALDSNAAHAMVIHGIETERAYLYIMDPSIGFGTATYTPNGYSYISETSNIEYVLIQCIIKLK